MEFWVCETIVQLKKSTKNQQSYELLMFLIICLYTGYAGGFFYNYEQIEIKSQN